MARLCGARGVKRPRRGAAYPRTLWAELTTVRQPAATMGRIAAELIIRFEPRRNGWPARMPRYVLEHQLVIRNSTAPPARV